MGQRRKSVLLIDYGIVQLQRGRGSSKYDVHVIRQMELVIKESEQCELAWQKSCACMLAHG